MRFQRGCLPFKQRRRQEVVLNSLLFAARTEASTRLSTFDSIWFYQLLFHAPRNKSGKCGSECGVRSAECGVRSAECGVRSAECGVRSAECGVRSAECGVRSAECGVRSAECGVRSAECILSIY